MAVQIGESDHALLTRARGGDAPAFEELYRRHHRAGMRAAQSYSRGQQAEDAVQEAFLRILHATKQGRGPHSDFRPYLATTVRNVLAGWGRSDKSIATDDLEALVGADTRPGSAPESRLRWHLLTTAFRSLPTRWQEALWLGEVEGVEIGELAQRWNMTPSAASALAYRAREGLRTAWLDAHIAGGLTPAECKPYVSDLGRYQQGKLSSRRRDQVESHLNQCDDCPALLLEVGVAASELRVLLLPTVLWGGTAAALTGGGGALAELGRWARRSQRSLTMGGVATVTVAGLAIGIVQPWSGVPEPTADTGAVTSVDAAAPGFGPSGGAGTDRGADDEPPDDAPTDDDATAPAEPADPTDPASSGPIDDPADPFGSPGDGGADPASGPLGPVSLSDAPPLSVPAPQPLPGGQPVVPADRGDPVDPESPADPGAPTDPGDPVPPSAPTDVTATVQGENLVIEGMVGEPTFQGTAGGTTFGVLAGGAAARIKPIAATACTTGCDVVEIRSIAGSGTATLVVTLVEDRAWTAAVPLTGIQDEPELVAIHIVDGVESEPVAVAYGMPVDPPVMDAPSVTSAWIVDRAIVLGRTTVIVEGDFSGTRFLVVDESGRAVVRALDAWSPNSTLLVLPWTSLAPGDQIRVAQRATGTDEFSEFSAPICVTDIDGDGCAIIPLDEPSTSESPSLDGAADGPTINPGTAEEAPAEEAPAEEAPAPADDRVADEQPATPAEEESVVNETPAEQQPFELESAPGDTSQESASEQVPEPVTERPVDDGEDPTAPEATAPEATVPEASTPEASTPEASTAPIGQHGSLDSEGSVPSG